MASVLVIEDERGLSSLIRSHLERDGHIVQQAFNGAEAIEAVRKSSPDLLVLDWMLPGLDGLSVCREIRRSHLMPIIMLTARDAESDRVNGLEAGADDYVVKPFSIAELLARVRAMLRRVALDTAAVEAALPEVLTSGRLRLDEAAFTATLDGQELQLTRRELAVLALLVRHPGRTFTREYLLDTVWGGDYDGLDRAVDTQMVRLRRKLGEFGQQIEAVWGVGYRFREPPT
ncbi:MAG TPA: response regulator transcription factor [Candidatus Limnocylindrales bacterium]|nr:response regulator transcription factor [Candidatus Limnocylindrales bacterium]